MKVECCALTFCVVQWSSKAVVLCTCCRIELHTLLHCFAYVRVFCPGGRSLHRRHRCSRQQHQVHSEDVRVKSLAFLDCVLHIEEASTSKYTVKNTHTQINMYTLIPVICWNTSWGLSEPYTIGPTGAEREETQNKRIRQALKTGPLAMNTKRHKTVENNNRRNNNVDLCRSNCKTQRDLQPLRTRPTHKQSNVLDAEVFFKRVKEAVLVKL